MEINYVKIEDRGRSGYCAAGCSQDVRALDLQESRDGLPVLAVGDRAFAGSARLTEVLLPESLEKIGISAFAGCSQLEMLRLADSIKECGAGAFDRCTALKKMFMRMGRRNYAALAVLLNALPGELLCTLEYPAEGKTVRIFFPPDVESIVYDGNSDSSVSWVVRHRPNDAGMNFRTCVNEDGIDYAAYDYTAYNRTFERMAPMSSAFAAKIALLRLQYPDGLTERYRRQYERYLESVKNSLLQTLILSGDRDLLRFFLEHFSPSEEAMAQAVHRAAREHRTEICSILMEAENRRKKAGSRTGFVLGGWDD